MWRLVLLAAAVLIATSCALKNASETSTDNPELLKILEADQKDREPQIGQIDWAQVGPRDATRRDRVKQLLGAGSVRSGKDFQRAALVFQHGDSSDDILVAHILAVTALGKGNLDARRMSANSLDRYLNRIGQPQVFGTQYSTPDTKDVRKWTMDPYHSALIGDSLREANCVESLVAQQELLRSLRNGVEPKEPKKKPCETAAAR
ncbi:MAG: hypothetical protein H7Y20_19550 [Bryobacteraceae bacterium]|nr:hypothetical protein [Bryobacteraceae bacterium]